ncbi:hypothetical protein Q7430_08750 [Glaesserella parasuis]|nr:hypothetical protein [Glaesserella parasuis]MDP0260470.1 hypothetical protein [Glaesserella parasuis]
MMPIAKFSIFAEYNLYCDGFNNPKYTIEIIKVAILAYNIEQKHLKNQQFAYLTSERMDFLIFLKKMLARFSEIPIMCITCLRQRNADLAQ